ncbi:ATPase, T2SS/T4P/T4SS family, partial [Oscillibacter sp.]|uniref:GspE/PulE family protein n=1 Tax=Oscillibacter sp. TaxID=1945593 RepID=UPI00289908C9
MIYTRLGDLLVSVGLISPEQLEHALEFQKKTKNRLGSELIEEKIITEQQLMSALQKQLGVECVDLSQIQIPPRLAELLPKNIARKYGIVPVKLGGNTLYIAMSDPLNFMAIEEVKTATRKRVVPMIATSANIERAISTLYGNEGAARAIEDMKREIAVGTQSAVQSADNFTASVLGGEEESVFAPTVRLVNSIIERAVEENASDIHIEPEEKELRVRMRIDGVMHSIMSVPKDLQASVISRLKIMGGMDITERRIPQDGRAAVRSKDRDVDLRMSTLPVIYGEKVVIRLLDKDAQLLSKERLGLMGGDLEKYTDLIQRPSGVVLIVGPTGSGKSSTMYTMIRELNTEQVNLISLEDPAENNTDAANHVQIHEKTGMTFPGCL